jgi:hypothetical protein
MYARGRVHAHAARPRRARPRLHLDEGVDALAEDLVLVPDYGTGLDPLAELAEVVLDLGQVHLVALGLDDEPGAPGHVHTVFVHAPEVAGVEQPSVETVARVAASSPT